MHTFHGNSEARFVGVVVLLFLGCGLARTDTLITLKLPEYDGASFANFSSLSVPSAEVSELEIIVQNALNELQVSSVRVKLNGKPLSVFTTVNPMPRGARLILKLGQTASPDFRVRPIGENILTLEALDQSRNKYNGQFFIMVDRTLKVPEIRISSHIVPQKAVEPPATYYPPEIKWASEPARETTETVVLLHVEVLDHYGLRRVVIEVNGRDVETIVLENSIPVRKRGSFRTGKALPGSIEGNGKHLLIHVPVELKKTTNVVAIRAENTMGLRTSASQTVVRVKAR